MKALLVAGSAVIAMAFASGTPAAAQEGPWCAHYDFGMDESVNCSFFDFNQCVASVHGMGGFCSQNPTYNSAQQYQRRVRRPY